LFPKMRNSKPVMQRLRTKSHFNCLNSMPGKRYFEKSRAENENMINITLL